VEILQELDGIGSLFYGYRKHREAACGQGRESLTLIGRVFVDAHRSGNEAEHPALGWSGLSAAPLEAARNTPRL
jgi:hypothetical protein